MNIDIRCGDCLELMKSVPDASVDAIMTDLPYGTTACAWDSIIDLDGMWNQFNRVAKPKAPVVLFGSQPFTTKLIASNMSSFRESLVWLKNKPASGVHCDRRHMKVHEDIIVFSRESGYTFNPIKWRVDEEKFLTHRKTMSFFNCGNNVYGGMCTRVRHADDGMRYPISILAYKIPMTPAKSKVYKNDTDIGVHPTQKPLELMKYLVKTYSNAGDTVMDATMGSGTTGIACVHTGRNFIGFEKDEKYFEISKQRIGMALSTPIQQELFK